MRGSAHERTARQLSDRLDVIVGKHPGVMKMQRQFARTWICQLGTLGGGNHFIELCLDEDQRVWVMLHSGSRGLGNVLGRYFIAAARKDMQRHSSTCRTRISLTSARARSCSTTTSRRCSGDRTTPGSTGAR